MNSSRGSTTARGRAGENVAATYLLSRGYGILARNFRSRVGEIDIIAGRDEVLAFVEVKAWGTLGQESLEHAIDKRKQGRIRTTSEWFLREHPELAGQHRRFDVMCVSGPGRVVRHIENAF